MSINLKAPELRELKPRIMVCGVGGAGGNAVNNMIVSGLAGVDFIVANTDAQALTSSRAERIIQMGLQVTEGLGAGSKPEVGRAAAEEAIEEIRDHLAGAHMVFVTAGMGGGTGTGAAPVIARVAREMGILTVGVVTKPFQFEGGRRMRLAEGGIAELHKSVDTLIIIPNQNLFRVANEKTTFADAFAMADQVLYSGVACITDLMVKEGLINLDFADVRSIMSEMGKAMMGTGEATGERRAVLAAEAAIANPLLDESSMKGARGLLISITGGNDLTLYEVDEAASRIRQEVDEEANIILGATFDSALDGVVRVSVVATGIDQAVTEVHEPTASQIRVIEAQQRLRAQASPRPQPVLAPADEPKENHPAPVAAAPSAPLYQEVEIRPVAPRQAAYAEPAPSRAVEEPAQREFFAPAPEQPVIRAQRMPQIEDLPPMVQQQVRIQRGEAAAPPAPVETRRRSLLEKLAAFGINRHDDPAPAPTPLAPRQMMSNPPAPAAAAAPQRQAPASAAQDYARPQPRPAPPRPAQGNLDPQGRVAARPAPLEDDHLEIPAFLRRQSN
jgi:cell division protein FtsZ